MEGSGEDGRCGADAVRPPVSAGRQLGQGTADPRRFGTAGHAEKCQQPREHLPLYAVIHPLARRRTDTPETGRAR